LDIVIRMPNWIGDCIMSIPALNLLKKKLPNDNIFLATPKYLSPLYKNMSDLTGIFPLPDKGESKNLFKTANRLKQNHFQQGLLFTNSFYSAFLFRLAGISSLTGYVKDCRGWLLKYRKNFPHNHRHHVFFYIDLAVHFLEMSPTASGIPIDGSDTSKLQTELNVTDLERADVLKILQTFGIDSSKPLLGISPSAAYGDAKEWLPERFTQLIHRIRKDKILSEAQILLFGSSGEKEKIDRIIDTFECKGVYNLAGRLELRAAITAISLCSLFISNDSGLMHIASSFKIPLVAIFGPTRPNKTGPLNLNSITLHRPPDCSPCLNRTCPLKENNHICMKSIMVDAVFDSVISLWKNSVNSVNISSSL